MKDGSSKLQTVPSGITARSFFFVSFALKIRRKGVSFLFPFDLSIEAFFAARVFHKQGVMLIRRREVSFLRLWEITTIGWSVKLDDLCHYMYSLWSVSYDGVDICLWHTRQGLSNGFNLSQAHGVVGSVSGVVRQHQFNRCRSIHLLWFDSDAQLDDSSFKMTNCRSNTAIVH